MTDRQQKVSQLLQSVVASYIQHEANTDPLITVTNVTVSPELKNATIYFTTIPAEKETDALIFLQRSATEMRQHVKQKMHIKNIPHLTFSIDYGERHRQHIDALVYETNTPSSLPPENLQP